MSRPAHPDLPYEQAQNADYLKRLKEWLERPVSFGLARSRNWVDPATHAHGKNYGIMHPLIGRVGLTVGEDLFEGATHFYIGVRRLPGDKAAGVPETISWLAPAAQAFFNPDHPDNGYYGQIAAIRTFTDDIDDIVAVDEEWFQEVEVSPFKADALVVPSPATQGAGKRRRMTVAPATTGDAESETVDSSTKLSPKHRAAGSDMHAESVGPAAARPQTEVADPSVFIGMRGAGAVLDRLAAPRRSELVSVIATLQPDQHRLVTWPPGEDLVIQGHPGTGKTVVAGYRAGFLITPRTESGDSADSRASELGGGLRRVLLVGPTGGYAKHVAGLLRPFERADGGTVTVTDLRSMMSEIIGLKSPWSGFMDQERNDLDLQSMQLCKAAAKLIRGSKTGYGGQVADRPRDLALTYRVLRHNGARGYELTQSAPLQEWLKALPDFDEAAKLRRYMPLLAQCVLAQKPPKESAIYDHIIVDEAQDLSAMEWSILNEHLHPLRGRWTLVGDQNQRRTTIGHSSWGSVAGQLGIGRRKDFMPEVMSRGYRSTSSILAFADGLLAPNLRKAQSIQVSGNDVRLVYERRAKRLYSAVVATAEEFVLKHLDGRTAIICTNPDAVKNHLLSEGWRRDPLDFRTFERDGFTLQLFSPAMARGLEFDAVVVVEPRLFDNDNGRHGQLYTSLTRANRELAVVHTGKLPKGLKAPAGVAGK